ASLSGFGTSAQWEKGKKIDAGLDFEFFKNRLKGSVEVFHNESFDMLFDVPLALTSTYVGGTVLQNLGKMVNKGVEIELHGGIIRAGDFNWNLSGNLATLNNKVTSLPEEANINTGTRIVEKGHKAYEWYLREWAGVDSDTGLPLWYIDRETSDETTSEYSEAKKVYTGYSSTPAYMGAISTRFDFKGFFLAGTLYFAGGHKIY